MRAIPACLLLLLAALAGCDVFSDDAVPYEGVVEVSLAEPVDVASLSLRLVAVEDASCGLPLLTSLEKSGATRRVEVEGIGRSGPVQCDAVIPASAVVALDLGPERPAGYSVEVEHAGATDLYALDLTGPAPTLTAVQTSTTRLAD